MKNRKRHRPWWFWLIVAALPVLGWRTYQVYFAPFDSAAWMQTGTCPLGM